MEETVPDTPKTSDAHQALENASTEEAWHLLSALSSLVQHKQAELQLMVGSRYHELIESADSIVSMKETSTEVLGLLRGFPGACSNVLDQACFVQSKLLVRLGCIFSGGLEGVAPKVRHAATLELCFRETTYKNSVPSVSNSYAIGNGDPNENIPSRRAAEVVKIMMHAPSALWAALDSNRLLEAASLLLRCRKGWAEVSTSFFVDIDPGLAAFLRSHMTYVEQFPHRITSAGLHILARSCSLEETAGALTALLQLEAHKHPEPLRCLLDLLLRRRGSAIVALLSRATKIGAELDVEAILQRVVTTVHTTIIHVHTIFSQTRGRCLLLNLAHPLYKAGNSLTLAESSIQELCMDWLDVLAPKIRVFSKCLLTSIGNANTLARIRGALWALTHRDGAWGMLVVEKSAGGRLCENGQDLWKQAAAFATHESVSGKDAGIHSTILSSPTPDLWALLFSKIFAELGDTLLRDSLHCIRQDVVRRLDSIIFAISGGQAGLTVQDGNSGYASSTRRCRRPLRAHEVIAAAEAVVSLLTSELENLAADAWSLTERGDEGAADSLRTSLYLLCVEMATGIVNHLRFALDEIHSCVTSAAGQERSLSRDSELRDLEDTIGSFADAGLVIGRIAWMLNGRNGRPLQTALTCPTCFAQRDSGRIEQQQLEAAFVIADTNGDGIVDADEAAEALQAVSFGASAHCSLDPTPYSSFTLQEFFLFGTRLLEEQQPLEHLSRCLDDLLATSLEVWSQWALERPARLLAIGCEDLAAVCRRPEMTDDLWRDTHGIWEDKTIELDRDDGDGIDETMQFPVMISPALLCYLESVAAELSRILSTADLLAARPAEICNVNAYPQGNTPGKRDWPQYQHADAQDEKIAHGAAQRARSLAAVRASRDLKRAIAGLCVGPQSPAAQACEAGQLQLLLDALFLRRWVSDSALPTAPTVESLVLSLCDLVDPINLQIYMPHLQTAASVCWSACVTSLSLIFGEALTHGVAVPSASLTPDGAVGSSSNFVALVSKVRRFEILPLPLDTVRLLPANGLPRARISLNHKSTGVAGDDGADGSAQVRGMQAGRQALAGLMDQVGSVSSVLSAQNVNVQSVLGAASLFLGRNRKGDEGTQNY